MLDKKIRRRSVVSTIVAAAVVGATVPETLALSVYRWKKRPLVIFAPSEEAAAAQRAIVAGDRAGFVERDMVVVYVIGNGVTTEFGVGPGLGADAMRKRYGVAGKDFRALLIGKDGGVKLSSPTPLSAAMLFREIDGMPMRQQAMRRRG